MWIFSLILSLTRAKFIWWPNIKCKVFILLWIEVERRRKKIGDTLARSNEFTIEMVLAYSYIRFGADYCGTKSAHLNQIRFPWNSLRFAATYRQIKLYVCCCCCCWTFAIGDLHFWFYAFGLKEIITIK